MVMLYKMMLGVALVACSSSMLDAGRNKRAEVVVPAKEVTIGQVLHRLDLKKFRKGSKGYDAVDAVIAAIVAYNESAREYDRVIVPNKDSVWDILMRTCLLDCKLGKDYERANSVFFAAVSELCLVDDGE